jgi:hypothetical protein
VLEIIEVIAAEHDIALFRRFEIMRHWHVDRGIRFDRMISNFDGNSTKPTGATTASRTLFDGLMKASAPD